MPVDAAGNRAELIVDPRSTIARINIGRAYEHYVNSASRDIRAEILTWLNIPVGTCTPDLLLDTDPAIIDRVWNYMLQYFDIISGKQHAFYSSLRPEEQLETICTVVNDDLYSFIPVDNDRDSVEMVKRLEATFKPLNGPVTYVGNSGNHVTTKANIRIAPMYIMLLEKIADDWSSVATGKLQHFGILSPITMNEKFTTPHRNSPVRSLGEGEIRLYSSYCKEGAASEMMDRSNNPATMRNMVDSIMSADEPGNIEKAVDREYIKLGNSKTLQLVKHQLLCAGFRPVYEHEDY